MIALALLLLSAGAGDTAATAAALRAAVASDANTLMLRPAIPDVRETLASAYQRNGWQPLWLDAGQRATPSARRLLAELAAARDRGLDPTQYDADRLTAEADSVPRRNVSAAAAFDVALSAAAARYADALDHGRVAADLMHPTLELARHRLDVARLLTRLDSAPDPATILRGLEPTYLHYRLLAAALIRYRQAQDRAAMVPVAWPAALYPGDSSVAAAELRHLLNLVGDLSDKDAARGRAGDSVRYDAVLALALRRFQARLKLRNDSIVTSATRGLLLRSLDDRVRQMGLALERWRWLPRDLPPATLFVNIPAFRLFTLDQVADQPGTLAMDVVVGRAADNVTPLLATRITAIQTHPAWMVPRAIAIKEIRGPALRDTTYLARHHYELLHLDSVLPPTRTNIRRIGDAVQVRQAPGPWNALGRLKFVTPNGADIYLHDTPERRYFRQARRDFSHGCIRVADPLALAIYALRDDSTWTAQRLAEVLADTIPRLVPLRRSVPVYILYQTVAVRQSGEVMFYPDVYGDDRTLAAALDAGYPYPPSSKSSPALRRTP